MRNKIIKWTVGTIALMAVTIGAWEQVDQNLAEWFEGDPIVYERQDAKATTVEGLIEEQAKSWLKGPEALEYAKKQVTGKLIEELSKR